MLVTAAGYQGDVLPFVSVARELVARGHEVDLVIPSGFHVGLRFEPAAAGAPENVRNSRVGPRGRAVRSNGNVEPSLPGTECLAVSFLRTTRRRYGVAAALYRGLNACSQTRHERSATRAFG